MFDKNDFVESVIERGLNRYKIVSEAQAEIHLTESISHRVKGVPANRTAESADHVRFLRALVFFLMSGDMPNSISDDEFQILLPLAQHLVDRGDFSPDILELFGAGGITG